MARLWQIVFLVGLSGLAWHSMQAVHELGHVVAALASGHTVEKVVLHPLTISRTDLTPKTTLWIAATGPLVGVFVPLLAWGIARACGLSAAWLGQLWAGFCLVANGAYIAVDPFLLGGDGKDLVQAGAPTWLLVVLGALAAVAGVLLLRGVGEELGFGEEPREITAGAAAGATLSWLVLALVLWLSFPGP